MLKKYALLLLRYAFGGGGGVKHRILRAKRSVVQKVTSVSKALLVNFLFLHEDLKDEVGF